MGPGVKIALIDDHRLFLSGLSILVESMSGDFETELFSDPTQLVAQLERGERFDLIVSDLAMGEMSGLHFIERTRAISRSTPILILTGISSSPPIEEIAALGANGLVHKSVGDEVLREAIETLLSGRSYFDNGFQRIESEELGTAARGEADSSVPPTRVPKLAPRQIEVLRRISEGASNREIAQDLSISEHTVKAHLRQIFLVMGVNKRTACVRKAQTLGII